MSDKKPRKKSMSVNVSTENFALLKWLNLNFGDKYSWIIDNLLSKYRACIMSDMTEYEKEQVGNLKTIIDTSIFDREKIKQARFKAFDKVFEENFLQLMTKPENRKRVRELLDLVEQK
jgi:hypothetical protein